MFERLKSEGVQVAPFYSVAHESQLDELIRAGLKYPIFIKPKASAGTDGCLRCENHVDLTNAFLKISKQRNLLNRINSEVLVQEYIRGTQYIVNTVSLGGHHLPCEVYRVRIDEIDGIPVYRSIVACDIDYTDATIQQAAELAASESQPMDDIRGSADYKRDLVRVLTARALTTAVGRAKGGA